jgi:hypothetical protein
MMRSAIVFKTTKGGMRYMATEGLKIRILEPKMTMRCIGKIRM